MNSYPYTINTIHADKAIIGKAKITKSKQRKKFISLIVIFILGALSFAVALSYNNFAQDVISKYSTSNDTIYGSFINLIGFTAFALFILYVAWRYNPGLVSEAI